IPIILHNPIHPSTQIHHPIIPLPFIQTQNSLTFILINKSPHHIPPIHEFFQQSFSTKPQPRALPLSTLKQIPHNPHNLLLHTIIQNRFFIQKLQIINNYP
ncbi:GHKL domain-containing protein, partial [Staphylococcus aureus]|uniref:GHKL domain-containing protein n=1 Tax=Staphylococcus aureus TaxID=1280 RepID=UPI0037D9EE9E